MAYTKSSSLENKSTPMTIPQKRILKVIIHTIQQYTQHKISLVTLTKLAEMILTSKNIVLSNKVKSSLEEIKSLSVVDAILADILDDLKQKHHE